MSDIGHKLAAWACAIGLVGFVVLVATGVVT